MFPCFDDKTSFSSKMVLHHILLFVCVTTLTRSFQEDRLGEEVLWSDHLDHKIYRLLTFAYEDILNLLFTRIVHEFERCDNNRM